MRGGGYTGLFLGEGGEELDVLRRALHAVHAILGQWGEDKQGALVVLANKLVGNLNERKKRQRERDKEPDARNTWFSMPQTEYTKWGCHFLSTSEVIVMGIVCVREFMK